MSTSTQAVRPRPLADLCRLLASLNADGITPDYRGASTELLIEIAKAASMTMRTAQLGMRSAGELVALSSPDLGSVDWPATTLESMGWLIAELSDLAATCYELQASCLRNIPNEDRAQLLSLEALRPVSTSPSG